MPDEYADLIRGVVGDDPNRKSLSNPRVRGFLNKIGKSEGADYNTLVGGRKINDLSKHPNVIGMRTKAGPSTAFGKYQIVGTTDRSKLRKYRDLDYSPENQDLRAVELLRQTGALEALERGDESTAIRRAGKEWASIPGSPLPGRKNTRAFAQQRPSSPDDEYSKLIRETVQEPVDDYSRVIRSAVEESQPTPSGRFGAASRSPTARRFGTGQPASQFERVRGGMRGENQPSNMSQARAEGEQRPSEAIQARGAFRGIARLAGLPTQFDNQASDWVNELAAKGTAGLMQTGAGAIKTIPRLLTMGKVGTPELADAMSSPIRRRLNQGASEIQQGAQAIDEDAQRNVVSQTAQDVGAGLIASAPALALQRLGIPAPIAFGLDAYLKAEGRDAEFEEVMKETGMGAAVGALFEVPLPRAAKLTLLRQIGAKLGIVGGGTFALDKITGVDTKEATKNAAVNALFAASGVKKGLRRGESKSVSSIDATRPRVQADQPSRVAPIGEGVRREQDAADVSSVETARSQPELRGENASPEVVSAAETPSERAARRNRRQRNVATGKAGQFKEGYKPAETPPEPQKPAEQPLEAAQRSDATTAIRLEKTPNPEGLAGLSPVAEKSWRETFARVDDLGGIKGVTGMIERDTRFTREQKDALISELNRTTATRPSVEVPNNRVADRRTTKGQPPVDPAEVVRRQGLERERGGLARQPAQTSSAKSQVTIDYNAAKDQSARAQFRETYPTVRFGVVNAVERRRSSGREIPPDFRTTSDGDLIGYRQGNQIAVYPRIGAIIEDVALDAGAFSHVFEFPDLAQSLKLSGAKVYRAKESFTDYQVSHPAIFTEEGGKWNLVSKGEIRTNGTDAESGSVSRPNPRLAEIDRELSTPAARSERRIAERRITQRATLPPSVEPTAKPTETSQKPAEATPTAKEPWQMTRQELRDTWQKGELLFDRNGQPIRIGDEVTLSTMYGPAKSKVTNIKVVKGSEPKVTIESIQVGPKDAFKPITEWELSSIQRVPYGELSEAQRAISDRILKGEDGHRLVIEQSLREGKPVPSEVLADYPDLASSVKPPTAIPEVKAVAPQTKEAETVAEATPTAIPEVKPEPSATSARKSQMASDRAELDLPELPSAERKSWRTSLENAKPERAGLLAGEVLTKPRALNDEETASLVVRAQEIKNEHSQVMKEIGDAKDADTIQAKRAQADALQREFDRLTSATKASGTEKGRTLAAQKLTINQDFDLVSVKQRMKAAKGRDLTPEESQRYEQIVKERDQAVVDRDKAIEEARVAKLQREITRSQRQRKRAETKQTLDDEAVIIKQNIAAEFQRLRSQQGRTLSQGGLGNLDPEGVITRELVKYARNRVKANVEIKAEALIDEVHGLVKDFGDISRREISEIISGYKMTTPERRPEDVRRLAEIRSEIKQRLKAEDVGEGKITEGQQGPKPDYVARERVKSVVQKRIDELKAMMESGVRTVRGKEPVSDAELAAMRAERDVLTDAVKRLDSESADKAIERALSAVDKSIAGMEGKLASGDITPDRATVSPWSKELGRKRQQAAELQEQLKVARKAAEPKPDPEQVRIDDAIAAKTRAIENIKAGKQRGATSSAWSPELSKLNRELADLQKQRADARKAATRAERAIGAKERQIAAQLKAVEKSIAETQAKIDRHDTSVKARTRKPTSPELEAARTTKQQLNETVAEMRKAERKAQDEAAVAAGTRTATQQGPPRRLFSRNATRLKQLQAQEADLSRRLEEGDFTKKIKTEPLPYTREVAAKQRIVEELESRFKREEYRVTRGTMGKIADTVAGFGNIPKTLKSMADISAVFRQGGFYAISHPIEGLAKPSIAMFKAFTDAGYRNVENTIKADADFRSSKSDGVEYTGVEKNDPRLSHHEEGYLGVGAIDTLAKGKFNPLRIVKGVAHFSERTFVSFLDSQRLHIYKTMKGALESQGITRRANPEAYKAIAKLINQGTGRGSLGVKGNQAAPLLNLAMFSPRLVTSRVQLLNNMFNPAKMATMPRGARSIMIKDNVKFLAGTMAVTGLAVAAGGKVSLDPDDGDFLKIRFGSTTYDTLTGLQQPLRAIINMGRAVKADVTHDDLYAGKSKGEIAGRFARSKLSPVAGAGIDYLTGRDFEGRQFSAKRAARDLVTPLPIGDFVDAMKKEGLIGALKAAPSVTGVGVQTYDSVPEKATTHAEKLARKIVSDSMKDKARTDEEIDKSRTISSLRARSRKGEDVTAEAEKAGASTRQMKAIEGAKSRTRLEEDVKGMSIEDAIRVYRAATRAEQQKIRDLLKVKSETVDRMDADRQARVKAQMAVIGLKPTSAAPAKKPREPLTIAPRRVQQHYDFQ